VQAFQETNEELFKEKITSLEADNENLKSKIIELEQHISHFSGKQDKATLS
jgi:predicted RNase H-like nuclease (RuvC/YqgF family)